MKLLIVRTAFPPHILLIIPFSCVYEGPNSNTNAHYGKDRTGDDNYFGHLIAPELGRVDNRRGEVPSPADEHRNVDLFSFPLQRSVMSIEPRCPKPRAPEERNVHSIFRRLLTFG